MQTAPSATRGDLRAGALAGLMGGVVLLFMLWQDGKAFDMYDLRTGSALFGAVVVLALAVATGAAFARFSGSSVEANLGRAIGFGLLYGLAWFIILIWIILPLLRGSRPFSLDFATMRNLPECLVYGLLLGTVYFRLVTP